MSDTIIAVVIDGASMNERGFRNKAAAHHFLTQDIAGEAPDDYIVTNIWDCGADDLLVESFGAENWLASYEEE